MTPILFKVFSEKGKTVSFYLTLVAAVFTAYSNVYGNALLFDDTLLINLNENLRHWGSLGRILTASTTDGAHIHGGFYRPVQMLLYFLIFQVQGESSVGYHLLNVSLHACNACLLFTLGRRMRLGTSAAFLGALIWAVHPIHTEAITYISGTADPLFVMFCLWGLIYLLPKISLWRCFSVVPIFLLALLSKETAVVFPALVVCCHYYVSRDRFAWRTYLPVAPLFLLAFLYVAWRWGVAGFDGPQTYDRLYQMPDYYNLRLYADHPSLRFYTFFATLPAYAGILIWPFDLHMERAFEIFASFWSDWVLVGFLMVLGAFIQILHARRGRGLPLSWGLLWFGAAHFPDAGILIPMNALFLEHWMYMPTMGFFVGAAAYVGQLARNHRMRFALASGALILAALLATRTWDQNRVWHDPITFYGYILRFGETASPRVSNNLALAYEANGENEKAIEQFKQAVATTDTYAETRHNLALTYLNLPDQKKWIPDAIFNLNRALEIDPNFYRSYLALANIYDFMGDHEKADAYRRKGEELLSKFGP